MVLERVLVIDVEDDFSALIKYYVRRNWPSAKVHLHNPVKDGKLASDFDWRRYDLLLLSLELGLRDENGLDWLRELQGRSDVPDTVILMTDNEPAVAREAMKLGARSWLCKTEVSVTHFERCISQVRGQTGAVTPARDAGDEKTRFLTRQELEEVLTGSLGGGRPKGTAPSPQVKSADRLVDGGETVVVKVPGYEIIGKIAQGGMASVHLARRPEDRRKLILKILHFYDEEDSALLRRFMREYAMLAKLEHPNVVRIYERAFASDYAYIAMEYFPHGDLAQRIASGISAGKAVEYIRQVALGLGAAHEMGMVHRDLKPGNVLFRKDDSLAITDFGIAKGAEANLDLTSPGMIMGTPHYISPEHITGAEADPRSDLYSLGVMFFELLTGRRPFRANSLSGLLDAHIASPIPRLPKGLVQLQPLIDGLLAKLPDERFQNTDELLAGLDWQ